MKKSILLMNTGMGIGGISASMINAANELSAFYDVYIFCYIPDGELKSRLNDKINIIDSCWTLKAICSTFADSKKLGFKYAVFKFFSKAWSTVINNRLPIYLAISKQPHLGHFDLACSFTHEAPKHTEYTGLIRVLIRKVDSPCKLSWIHCDYNSVKRSTFNYKYFRKMNSIIGCSESVAKAFIDNNPKLDVPVDYCYNMIDYENINKLSKLKQEIKYPLNGIICFSACRLSKIKGLNRALECFSETMKNNNVYWFIAGDGSEKEKIQLTIKNNDLEDRVFLIGEQSNPFNYMRNADLYVSTSFEEAAPLVYLEAKAVNLPVFSTKTLSTKELLSDDVDFISENNIVDMKRIFSLATCNRDKLKQRRRLLENCKKGNDKSINVFRNWLGD